MTEFDGIKQSLELSGRIVGAFHDINIPSELVDIYTFNYIVQILIELSISYKLHISIKTD